MSLYAECRTRFPELVARLERARSSGRLAHAFLVASASETVRSDFALALAMLAGCPRSGAPDGDCDYCRKIENGSWPELHTLSPVGKMYQIKVGDRINPEPNTLRHFIAGFHLTASAAGQRKIGIVREADRMNDEAQNALLKTLEEPPPDTTLVLCTGNPGSLLPTTRSRCQLLTLPGEADIHGFAGAEELFSVLADLCFFSANDPVRTENAASALIRIAAALAAAAEEKVRPRFARQLEDASGSGDNALLKRIELRCADAVSGEYMRDRVRMLAAIDTFCSQVFMLSCGIPLAALPHPELFATVKALPAIPEERGEAVREEGAELRRTLRFNVSEELALRTFAMKLALA